MTTASYFLKRAANETMAGVTAKARMAKPTAATAFIPILALLTGLIVGAFAGAPALHAAGRADASLAHVRQQGTLVVGVDIPYGIMEFYDDSGNPKGIDMDIARAIAARMGVKMGIKTMPFSKLFGSVKSGEVDVVISAVTITHERQKEMLFSVPYLDAGMSIAVREDNTSIQSKEDLKSKKVGVLKGTVGEKIASESPFIDASLLKRYENNEKRIQDLLDGKLDAIIVHFLVKDLKSIKIVGEPLSHSYYGIVTRLENQSLMDGINKTLRAMKRTGELVEIKRKYIDQAQSP